MVCASCGWATQAGARFCGGCGATLAPRCPGCGVETRPNARFCEACGVSLADQPVETSVARKVVTIVFADLVGSTALHERLDAEAVRQFMERYYAAMRGAVEAHGGRVTQLMGDGVKAVFGAPRVAEDDALRAVRAAVEMQRAFRALADEQRERVGKTGLRVAVNTGEVVADGETEIIGDPVNVAARLQEQGRDGDVVIGGSTQRIVASLVTLERLGSFALKGRSEAVEAYRVASLERPAGAAATPFVGRDDELARLTAVYDAAVAAPAARLAVLLGSPGLGKSRLLAEVARQLEGRARVLTAQCNPSGGATFAPLAEALRAHFGVETGAGDETLRAALDALVVSGNEAERAQLAVGMDALLTGTPALPEEIFFAVRRLLAALAAEQPVVLAIDDLQWAEPLLLDFTEHLVQWGAGVPLLVLGAARPELRDTRSNFTTPGGLVSEVVTLGGLDAGAAMRLAASVIGADTLPAAVAGRVLATSEGNPLFVGELIRMLVNDGALRREGERWTLAIDLAALEMPPTIQALLAARIERLRPEERLVLERAAVVGRRFSRAVVTHLLPREAHADLDTRLEALRRSELIEADAGWLLGEPALRFHHVLVRDAAYRQVLRGTRAELHARFADWLEARAGESAEHDETIGWHLEQAHQHLRELGPLDANGRALGERAARHLAAAGRRALARDDLEPAGNLLGRALDCLGDADPARAELALDWCEALLSAGDVGRSTRALADFGRFTAGSERLGAWYTCFSGQLAALADPKALRTSVEAVAAAAGALAAAGDVAGEAKAHQVHADALARLGMIGACEAALDKALAAARRAGARRRANAVLAGAPLAALWGPSPVTRASGRCLDVVRVLRITQGAPAVEAVALRCQAVLETLRGRSEAARRMIASSRRLVEDLAITQRLLEVDTSAGLIELLEGDATAAEAWLRPAYEGFREHGLGVGAARAAALLGRALLAQGRAAEAEALSHESEALAGDDFQVAIAWRGVRAEALAGRGEHAAAVELARAAVDIAAATDDLLDHADARSALAVALRAAGRSSEADAEEARAIELWEQKGATLLAERARRSAVQALPPARAPEARAEGPRPVRRRVRENAATANARDAAAALVAGNGEALASLLADDAAQLDHTTGTEVDRAGVLRVWHSFFGADAPTLTSEPLATLGEALALCRYSVAAMGVSRPGVDVGAYETGRVVLIEVDGRWRRRWAEYFAADRLGDAVARLYERHADLLPDGAERARAAATARSAAALTGPPDRWPFVPDVEATDHRTVGWGSLHGAEAVLRAIRALIELSDDFANRIDDVLGLRSDALLVRWTNSGTDRASGGAFERRLCQLWVFGAEGRVSRWEQFDADREAEALARFDELAAKPPAAHPVRRRVRSNAATAHTARIDAAIAGRDADALPASFSDEYEVVDHTTGTAWHRREELASWRALLSARDLTHRHELLATVGGSLALCRVSSSASAYAGGAFDVGGFEREGILLIEVDAQGRGRRAETFAPERLGDAVVRLYERHAELLPEGPERTRAAVTARALAAWNGPLDLDRLATSLAPSFESVDHRIIGTWSARGAEAFLQHWRAQFDVASANARDQDVLALEPAAFLVRRTWFGTDRDGGGAFENVNLALLAFGVDGLLTRAEVFDSGREAEALARFDAVTAESPAERPVRRRVRPNAVTALVARLDAAIGARDADAIADLYADPAETVHHPTGATYDRRGALASWRSLLDARDPTQRSEPLASLGDALGLGRQWASASGLTSRRLDVGAYETEKIVLIEADAKGRIRRGEVFAPDRLGDAVVRLYERYAELLPDGPERTRAAATARSVAVWNGPLDLDRYATFVDPSVEVVDHRILGTWSARGLEEWMRHWRSQHELAAEGSVILRDGDVLALEPDAFLVRRTYFGRDRASGGVYETPLLTLFAFGADGLLTRSEAFDPDREAEALARFDELTAEPPSERFANAAWRAVEAQQRAVAARDWDALVARHAPGFVFDDRRSLVRTRVEGETAFANLRPFFDACREWSRRLVATRGDRLALVREVLTSTAPHGGLAEFEMLAVVEVDATGRGVAVVAFDPDALDAAYAELDARYGSANAARLVSRINARDWEGVLERLAPELVVEDHRRLGWEPLHGPAAYIASLRALADLAPDARLRFEHLEESGRASLGVTLLSGTREGGAFEDARVLVAEFDTQGRGFRLDFFDRGELAEARVRCDAIGATAPPDPLAALVRPNAASAAMDRVEAAFEARDWAAVRAVAAEGARFEDRRRHALLSGDADWWVANLELEVHDSGLGHFQRRLVATAGDRICLERSLWIGGPADGRYEIECLWLAEVDESGRMVAGVMFDVDDRQAAIREATSRWLAHDAAAAAVMQPALEVLEGWNDRNRARMRDVLADDFAYDDRRLTGEGRVDAVDSFLDNMAVMWRLSLDVQVEPRSLLALERHGSVTLTRHSGTFPGGGAFENYIVHVVTVARGRVTRLELFEPAAADAALARLAELRPDPLRIPPNAATRASDRWSEAVASGDWETVEALFAPALVFEDRRRGFLTRGDREMLLANDRLIGASRPHTSRTVLATAGDRLALHRILVRGTYEGAEFEREFLRVIELDAEGRLVAAIAFDPDDRRAASRELLERSAHIEGPLSLELRRAFFAHDHERVRAVLPAGFVFHDHRRVGAGRIERADDYVAWLAGLFERSADAIIEPLYVVASEAHGTLSVGHTFGTLADGGAFESVYCQVVWPLGVELFELDDLELARARFEELRPDPTRIPPNAASRARDRSVEAWKARDWDALRLMASDDFVFEDRGKRALVSGGVEMWLENNRFTQGGSVERDRIATAGDRIALERDLLIGEPGGGPVEIENLRLTEVDADGRIRAVIRFDPDDRAAAFAEAQARFAAGEAAASGGQAAFGAFLPALTRHDWQALRSCLAEDAVIWDRRALGILGTLDRDQWLESLTAAAELAPDVDWEVTRILTWNGRGRVHLTRMFGTRDGGPFESPIMNVILTGGDRIERFEFFDVADADQALARFEELSAGRS